MTTTIALKYNDNDFKNLTSAFMHKRLRDNF